MVNLEKIKSMLFNDIELVLDNLGIEYEIIGDNVYSTCPVHEDSDNKRAFSLSLDKQMWRCWTRDCQHHYSSDIFGLITGVLSTRSNKETSFKEALLWACKILNVDSNSVKVEKPEEPSDFVKMVDIFSHCHEIKSPHTGSEKHNLILPSDYFINRGFKEKTLLHFGVGDCEDKGGFMSQRAVIPIHDDTGSKIVAYIGRAIKEYRKPKFLFTKGFDKGVFLYNYHRAISTAIDKSCLFITEGQGDVWKLYEAGVKNAVSIFGKTLSTQQKLKIEKSGVTQLVILTDDDQAGRESKTALHRQLSRMFKLSFPRLTGKDIGEMNEEQIKTTILYNMKGTF
jgi:5S rRNA maturation endonuclease (ribonuclease M5)